MTQLRRRRYVAYGDDEPANRPPRGADIGRGLTHREKTVRYFVEMKTFKLDAPNPEIIQVRGGNERGEEERAEDFR